MKALSVMGKRIPFCGQFAILDASAAEVILPFSVSHPNRVDNTRRGVEFGFKAAYHLVKVAGGRWSGKIFAALLDKILSGYGTVTLISFQGWA